MLAIVTASIAAFAQSQTPAPLTTITAKKPAATKPAVEKPVVTAPLVNFNPLKTHPEATSDKVYRVDGISSQPWYVTAGSKPGWSAFPESGQGSFGFNLFWVGTEPRR